MSTGQRTRGRPRVDRTDALDALVELFWQQGYNAATQDAMQDSTGLSSSNLYRAFGTKAQTFNEALSRYLKLADDMLGPLEWGTQGLADLQALLDRMTGWLGSANAMWGCMVVATTQDPVNRNPQVAALTRRHLDRIRTALRSAVTRAVDAGETLPISPELLINVFYAAMLGILVTVRTGDRTNSLAIIDGLRALLTTSN